MKHETQFRTDVIVGALFVRQLDAQADGLPPGLGRPAVGRFHDSRSSPGTDHEAPRMIAERHGPGSDAARQFARLFVVAGHLHRRFRAPQRAAVLRRIEPLGLGLLQLLQMRLGLNSRKDSRRTEHHDRIAHLFAAQPFQRVNVLRDDAHGPRRKAFHEQRIAIGRLDFLGTALTTHEPSSACDCNLTFYASAEGKRQRLDPPMFRLLTLVLVSSSTGFSLWVLTFAGG